MIEDAAQVILNKIRYKDWKFQATSRSTGTLQITVSHPVQNSDEVIAGVEHPECGTSKNVHAMSFAYQLSAPLEDILLDEVWRMVIEMEMHEAGEFFAYNGSRLHYPHPPKVI